MKKPNKKQQFPIYYSFSDCFTKIISKNESITVELSSDEKRVFSLNYNSVVPDTFFKMKEFQKGIIIIQPEVFNSVFTKALKILASKLK